jgi:hypothetical protein
VVGLLCPSWDWENSGWSDVTLGLQGQASRSKQGQPTSTKQSRPNPPLVPKTADKHALQRERDRERAMERWEVCREALTIKS